jgi:glycosyltransferase involved in cell wall biosynthesis
MSKKELALVMPVYNEEECIQTVINKWSAALDGLKISYDFFLINDGSKDGTLQKAHESAGNLPNLRVINKPNEGHGPTILFGYLKSKEYPWIFQVDSDDELGPENFGHFWAHRNNYDLLIGIREGRHSPLPRKIVSMISRLVVRICYGKGVEDVNCPFRLMRSAAFRPAFEALPKNTFAPNVIISGYACHKKLRIFQDRVLHKERQTGEVSIKKWSLLKAAMKSFLQCVLFRMKRIPH